MTKFIGTMTMTDGGSFWNLQVEGKNYGGYMLSMDSCLYTTADSQDDYDPHDDHELTYVSPVIPTVLVSNNR